MKLKNLVKLKKHRELKKHPGTEEASDTGEDDGIIIKTSGRCKYNVAQECKKYVESKGKKMSAGFYSPWAKGCIKPPDGHGSGAYDYFYQMGDYEKDCSATTNVYVDQKDLKIWIIKKQIMKK